MNNFADSNESVFLSMGDQISLFSVDGGGYLASEGFIDTSSFLQSTIGDSVPTNFTTDSIFNIVPRYKYDAQIALNEYLERWSLNIEHIGNVGDKESELKFLKVSKKNVFFTLNQITFGNKII